MGTPAFLATASADDLSFARRSAAIGGTGSRAGIRSRWAAHAMLTFVDTGRTTSYPAAFPASAVRKAPSSPRVGSTSLLDANRDRKAAGVFSANRSCSTTATSAPARPSARTTASATRLAPSVTRTFTHHLEEDRFHALDHLAPVVVGRDVGAAAGAQRAVSIRQETPDAAGDRRRRRVVEQELQRSQHFGDRPHGRPHRRRPARHRLDRDEPEPLERPG